MKKREGGATIEGKDVIEDAVNESGGGRACLSNRCCTTQTAFFFSRGLFIVQFGLKSGHTSPVNERGAVKIRVKISKREKYFIMLATAMDCNVLELRVLAWFTY